MNVYSLLKKKKNEDFGGIWNRIKTHLRKKTLRDNKVKQWSEYLHKGYSEFKVHTQEGVAGKESKES